MAGGFYQERERIEAFWQKHPLPRAYGLWLGLMAVCLLISFLPLEVMVGNETFTYAGREERTSDWRLQVQAEGEEARIWKEGQLEDEGYTAQERAEIQSFGRRSATRLQRALTLLALTAAGLPFVRRAVPAQGPSEDKARRDEDAALKQRRSAAWVALALLAMAACLVVA